MTQDRPALALLSRTVFAETKNCQPRATHKKKPLIERAKAAGASHKDALAWANKTIERMEKRAQRVKRKLDAKKTARVTYNLKFAMTFETFAREQEGRLQPTTDKEIMGCLVSAGLKTGRLSVYKARRELLEAQVRIAFARLYCTYSNGCVAVYIGNKAGVTQDRYKDWNLYRGRFKGWAADIVDTDITVRKDYWKRLSGRNLHVVAGRLLLDAKPTHSKRVPEGFEAYRAIWIEQARGKAVEQKTGYVVRQVDGRQTALFNSLDDAVSGVKRSMH